MAIGLFTTIINAKLLTIGQYSNLVIIILFISIFEVFNNIGIKEYIKSRDYSKEQISDVFTIEFLKGAIISVFVCLYILFVFKVGEQLETALIIASLSPIVFSLKSLKIYEINRDVNFIPLNTIELLSSLISSILLVLMLFNEFGIISFACSFLFRSALVSAFSQWYCPVRLKLKLNFGVFKKILNFSSWIIMTNIVFLLASRLDQMIVVKNFSAYDIANYGFAFKMIDSGLIQPMKIFTSLSTPLYLNEEKRKYVAPFYLAQIALIIVLSLFITFFAPYILNLIMPNKWNESFYYFPYLCIAGALLSARNNGVLWYSMKTKLGFRVEVFRASIFSLIVSIIYFLGELSLIALIYALIFTSLFTYIYWSRTVCKLKENQIPKLVLNLYPVIPMFTFTLVIYYEFYSI